MTNCSEAASSCCNNIQKIKSLKGKQKRKARMKNPKRILCREGGWNYEHQLLTDIPEIHLISQKFG
jgi:hypothetical protein